MFMKYARVVTVFMLVSILSVLSSGAWAKSIYKVSVKELDKGIYSVLISGRPVIRFEASNGDMNSQARAKVVGDRLSALLADGLDPAAISSKKAGKNTHVMTGESLLAVATARDSKLQNLTSEQLAQTWAKNIKSVLSLPILQLGTNSAVIPLGGSASVKLDSLQPDEVTAVSESTAVASVSLGAERKSIEIKGLSVGKSQVTVKCGDCTESIDVTVKKYAGSVSTTVERALVTGSNPGRELIGRAVEEAARKSVSLEPGAQITSVRLKSRPETVSAGEMRLIPVSVETSGNQYLPIRLSVPVTVENRVLAKESASELMYSNAPERVSKYQVLFSGEIDSEKKPTRLLYHHQNMVGKRIGFVIEVVNYSAKPMSLHIMEGISAPMYDTVIVGYKAGDEFLGDYVNGVGRIIDIPGESRRVLVSQGIPAGYTASGILELRELSGDRGVIRVIAKPEEERIDSDAEDVNVSSKAGVPTTAFSAGVYPSPAQKMHATYKAGSRWLFMRLGDRPLKCASGNGVLYGNYGVTCDIQLKLENPTEEQQTVELAFEAPAGPASGIFIIDGKMERVRMLLPPKEVSVGRFVLAPGNNRTVSIYTMPLSGSAYPATIIVRPAGVGSAFLKK